MPEISAEEHRRRSDQMFDMRLQSIEKDLKEILVELRDFSEHRARSEEQYKNMISEIATHRRELDSIYPRLNALEINNGKSGQSVANIERFGWVCFSGFLTFLVEWLKK